MAGLVLMFWFMSRQGKKAQARQREKVENALVPGAWVQTIARSYHQVVEVNGEIITLSNPDGSEQLVHRTGIAQGTQSPYELMAEDDADDAVDVSSVDDARETLGEDRPAIEQSDDWHDNGSSGRA